MQDNKKVLITGAGGFIGSYLLRRFSLLNGIDVLGVTSKSVPYLEEELPYKLIQRDIMDKSALLATMNAFQPDYVLHFAADANGNAGGDALVKNVEMTKNVLDTMPKSATLIFSSSITVYGDNTMANEQSPKTPTSLYGLSKCMCEDLIDLYRKNYGIRAMSLRLCATVGPDMTHGFIKDLIRKIKAPGDKLELFGNRPGTCKPYIHVRTVESLIYDLITFRLPIIDAVNVSALDSLSVLEIANHVLERLDIKKEIVWGGNQTLWKGDNQRLWCDVTLLNQMYQIYCRSMWAIDEVIKNMQCYSYDS